MQKQPSEVFLEISQNSQENTCARVSFLIKLQEACNFIKKEALAQVFSCEFCEISENTFFIEHLWTAASGNAKKKFNTDSFLKTKFFEKSRIYFKMARTKPRVVLQTFESTGLLQWTILKTKIAVIFTVFGKSIRWFLYEERVGQYGLSYRGVFRTLSNI